MTLRGPFGVYYGWVIVASAFTMNLVAAMLSPSTFSFFIPSMIGELGWSRSELALAVTFRFAAAGLFGPVLGTMIDRSGVRWIGAGAGVIVGVSLIALSMVGSLWSLYVIFAVSGLAGLGGPGGSLLTSVPVAKWFRQRRGRAFAVAAIGLPLGAAIWIQVAQWLIATIGWRPAWVVFGLVFLVMVSPACAALMRRTPEDHGLVPDGRAVDGEVVRRTNDGDYPEEVSWTRTKVVRSSTAWIIVAGLVFIGFALTGTLVHRTAFWLDQGLAPRLVALATALDPTTVIFSSFAFGLLAERLPLRYIALTGGVGFGVSMVPAVFATGHPDALFAHNIMFGFFAGAYVTTLSLVWVTHFGRRDLGAVQGLTLPLVLGANALGPPAYGYLLDIGLGPGGLWTLSAILFAVGGLLIFTQRPSAPPRLGSIVVPVRHP